jgi:predicted nucleic acid-binding protein
MELLGYPGITADKDALIRQRLAQLTYLSITFAVEDKAIELRRSRRIKRPDALIAATALCHGLKLLSMDVGLQSVLHSAA